MLTRSILQYIIAQNLQQLPLTFIRLSLAYGSSGPSASSENAQDPVFRSLQSVDAGMYASLLLHLCPKLDYIALDFGDCTQPLVSWRVIRSSEGDSEDAYLTPVDWEELISSSPMIRMLILGQYI